MEDFKNEEALEWIIDELDDAIAPDNKRKLDDWRNLNAENEKTYREFQLVQNNLDILLLSDRADEENSWKILSSKLEDREKPKTSASVVKWAAWLSIAASLIFVVSFLFYPGSTLTYTTASKEIRHIILPDGSTVDLNQNASISFNKNTYTSSRGLTLNYGEAFFDVIHDPSNHFVIDAGNIKINDLGTSFNLLRNKQQVQVAVASGLVSIENSTAKTSEMVTPGNKAVVSYQTGQISTASNTDKNFKSWIDKKLIFDKTPLKEVAQKLSETYHETVTLRSASLTNRKLTATLQYKDLDSALNVITTTLQIKVKKNTTGYLLIE
ncbi:DUF4974 domain-containing protein [Pedobacter sp. HMF7647]|uniref:DUF4974 domain-containing protein n=1 Tax=Hufsiella arboris TaxID=2695275 RepID=A0A7K1YAH7_9SPHI|nr:FecR domain-containing protein [Hufsiella arboris]MXV51585.1 DUF4974 domain-containing protein [Hufsiella arboris]